MRGLPDGRVELFAAAAEVQQKKQRGRGGRTRERWKGIIISSGLGVAEALFGRWVVWEPATLHRHHTRSRIFSAKFTLFLDDDGCNGCARLSRRLKPRASTSLTDFVTLDDADVSLEYNDGMGIS